MKKTIVVWFSCGAASAVAAKKTIEIYSKDFNVRVVNTPVKEEHEDNRRFLKDVEKWIGQKIEIATNSKFPSNSIIDVFNESKYMSGNAGAPCTVALKKEARYLWEANNEFEFLVLGYTLEEKKKRHDKFILSERENLLPVLIDLGLTKNDCFKILEEARVRLPEIYSIGFPNANCIGCVKASSPTYWNLVREKFPEVFKQRAEQSREIGCKLTRVKGKRIFLDELSLSAKGNKLKNYIDCGIFCEGAK